MNNVSYFTITSFKLLFDSGKLNTTRLHPIPSLSLTFLSPQRLISVGQSFHQTAALPGIVVCERFRLFLVLLELSLNITFFVPTRGKLMFQAIDSGILIYHLRAQIQSIKPPWVLCQFLFPRSVLSSGQWTHSSQNFAAAPPPPPTHTHTPTPLTYSTVSVKLASDIFKWSCKWLRLCLDTV